MDNGPQELDLARRVRQLDREMMPDRDLWPGIERQISRHSQRRVSWGGLGIAASLIMATCALALSVMDRAEMSLTAVQLTLDESLVQMDDNYQRVRNPLEVAFGETNKSLDDETLDDLYRNIRIMRDAGLELERLVRAHPEERKYVEMLMRVHEQELELLKRDYTGEGQSM